MSYGIPAGFGPSRKPIAIISLSGGLASASNAILADMLGIDYELAFADTTIEAADLYRFVEAIARRLNKHLHVMRDGRDPWQACLDVGIMGDSRKAPCSRILKTDQIRKLADDKFKITDPLILGMGLGEIDRLERAKAKWAPRPVRSFLVEHRIPVAMYGRLIAAYGIQAPTELYSKGFPHNNCGGFCFRMGLKQAATLLTHFPERYARHEAEEQNAADELGEGRTYFLKDRRNGEISYISLKEFREAFQSGTVSHISPYDWGGCGCMTVEEDQ